VTCSAARKKEGNAKAGADGRFRLTLTKADAREKVTVVATAKDFGPDWVELDSAAAGDEITLRLVPDDVPFTGRVAGLENQPLKGVTVEVVRLLKKGKGDPQAPAKMKVDVWGMFNQLKNVELDVAKPLLRDLLERKEGDRLDESGLTALAGALVPAKTRTTTDADGKFTVNGLGRDRTLVLRLHGPNVETKILLGVTRPAESKDGNPKTSLYWPGSTLLLAPSRPLVGTVRDAKTEKPVAGVWVSELGSNAPVSVTDEQGRYRIEGVKMKEAYTLIVTADPGLPYFDALEQRAGSGRPACG
jgi:hypothetical protein